MKRIIIVCSGNICRSPMAHRLLQVRSRDAGLKLTVLSMGTLDIQGRPAHPLAIMALDEIGVNLGAHRSQGVSLGLLAHADMTLVMETHHATTLIRGGADPRRIRLMGSYAPDPVEGDEISDPVAGTIDDFRLCRDRLVACVDALIHQIS